MADKPSDWVQLRDHKADVRKASTEGEVQEVRHYVMRAEPIVYTGLLSGERNSNRVQGQTDEQGQDKVSSSEEGKS